MKLSVIIVSYNVSRFLAQCLDTVQQAIAHIEADVWVVDNASTDNSVEMVRNRYPWVNLIAQKQNTGFSRGNNTAIRQSKGEYILLLNPDTLVAADTIQRCIEQLDSHPEAGATGARQMDACGRFALESRRGLPTPFTSFCKMLGLTALFPRSRTFGRYYMRYLDEQQPAEIDVMSGAFMMLRRSALDKVGMFDEQYFMYGEDIDLSYRILQGGWKNRYTPAPLIHYKGESTHKSSFRYVHVFYNAMLIFYNKHFSQRYRLLTLVIKLAVLCRGAIDYLQQNIKQIIRTLIPSRPNTSRFVIRCNPSEQEQIAALCSRHHLITTFVPRNDATILHDCVVVIDHQSMLEMCSSGTHLDEMLNLLHKNKSELGVWNSEGQYILTTFKTFS